MPSGYFTVSATQPLSSLSLYLLSTCTPLPQQPKSFLILLTCSAPVPVHHSSHPRLSIMCSKSSLCVCLSLPPSASPNLSLSLSLSVSCFPVAHAAETLYLIHYNTSRLTPSQMGCRLLLVPANWAACCLTGCCIPLQLLLPPSLFPRCPHATHSQDDKECWALLLPAQCSENALSLQEMSTLPAVASISLCSPLFRFPFLYFSSSSTPPDLFNVISLLAIYGMGCYGNYGLHLSFNRSGSLSHSLTFISSSLLMCNPVTSFH